MNCDFVQERLSAFLDREESTDNIEAALSHLYGCESCQNFFSTAVKLHSLASDDRMSYPAGLDESISRKIGRKQNTNALGYQLRIPVYVVSMAAVILLIVSFAIGFMLQENMHRDEINAILKAVPSHVVYGMPTQVVYPVSIRDSKGAMR
ncbi:MAG: zf-HC2 domain-containing protein [Bacteroidetes bacterium]|nr:zf-HC2 domain-containing protein [Bacteroidota bacterium]